MLESLKNKVYYANQDLMDNFGSPFSWTSVSAVDRETGLVVLMPEGGALEPEDMAVVDLDGRLVEGGDPPVCDTAVHLGLYKQFPEIGSVAHPYSRWATVFAQLDMAIPTLGTVHANTFAADVPAVRVTPEEELLDPASAKVAEAIGEAYRKGGLAPLEVPAVLVSCQGAYAFGRDARSAVNNAVILDEAAFLAYHTMQLDPGIRPLKRRKGRKI